MKKECLLVFLVTIIFLSGCVGQNGGGDIKYNNNALKLEYEITEKIENRRILPGQTIRMVVYLTNQVENDTLNVSFMVSDPFGIKVTRINCGNDCNCDQSTTGFNNCGNGNGCYYNGCIYEKIQSLDAEEIDISLKIPVEEEIAAVGHELEPELTLEYDYSGETIVYIPITKYDEKLEGLKPQTTQTTGPIQAEIETDNWVFEDSIFPVYMTLKDVVGSQNRLDIIEGDVRLFLEHIESSADVTDEDIGRCDFRPDNTGPFEICGYYECYRPTIDIVLPMRTPLVCSLRSEATAVPIRNGIIGIEYAYRYEVKKREIIRVEKGLV